MHFDRLPPSLTPSQAPQPVKFLESEQNPPPVRLLPESGSLISSEACAAFVRALNLERDSEDVAARYKRCAAQWKPHLDRTQAAILRAAHATQRKRKAALLGAGLLHDIPLAELSQMFEQVFLVDVVHSRSCRIRASLFANVTCIQADVTACAAHLLRARQTGEPLPHIQPDLFDGDLEMDLTISVNILSQLGCAPAKLLQDSHSAEEIRALQRHLIEAHLAFLRTRPGLSALITDFEWSSHPRGRPHTQAVRRWDVLHQVPLPAPQDQWDWLIAPAPESDLRFDFVARVAAFPDWKSASSLVSG